MKHAITALAAAAFLAVQPRAAEAPKPELGGGLIMGYTYGQNGMAWPSPASPLENNSRGGFYVAQTRYSAALAFDSTFQGVIRGNLLGNEVIEAYLRKDWGAWSFKAGKFRGAGLRSASADEFEQTTINKPRYARLWGHYKKLHNFSDFGVQVDRSVFSGRLKNSLFVHNGNGENVFNDEPAFPVGPSTQVLGFDYAFDLKVSRFSSLGGHVGALAYRQWDEFVGSHDAWEVQYWFKSNPILDMSLNHRMDFPLFHLENEGLVMWNRAMAYEDGSPMVTWGASTLARFDRFRRWSPYLGYEFFDHSDGKFTDDALHMFKLGTFFRPSPERYPGLRVTGQYVRALEEGAVNTASNDVLHTQLQMTF